MNSYERTMAAVSHSEADRVPLFLLLSYYGAKELQIPIKEYFSNLNYVIHAQLTMHNKYNTDCLYAFFYASLETEAFGGEVLYSDDGPPNAGEPLLKSIAQIEQLKIPKISESKPLQNILELTGRLKEKAAGKIPIVNIVVSPYSLPVLQMGFEKYLQLIYEQPETFNKLMQINEEFCVLWANAQLAAGATVIGYFNPLASPAMIEKKTYLKTGYVVDKRTISRIKGPTATHLASSIALPVLEEIIATGSPIVGISTDDNLVACKKIAKGKICLLGNLNALEMRNWDEHKTFVEVKKVIARAGVGGGLLLADNHGEIPWQVPQKVLQWIGEAVQEYGRYPLTWAINYE